MAGAGVVLPNDDAAEVERRNQSLRAELGPKSSLGQILVLQMATLSVRMERGAKQEFAHVAARVRNAADEFDSERLDRAEELFEGLGDNPRLVLRQLRKSPEGVDRLIEGWREVRRELPRDSRTGVPPESMDKVAHLSGLRKLDLAGSRIEALGKATWGYFGALAESERLGLENEAVKGWARNRLIETVDAEIAALEAHAETLDHATIEQDRGGAADRSLFDPSREATLARRYESEARRGFFKALDKLHKVEAEAAERRVLEPAPVETVPVEGPPLASSRESGGVTPRDPRPALSRMAQGDESVILEPRNRTEPARRRVVRAG